ncbi:MAG: diphosphomevalonate decarboxylase [Candidatus Micrarchaeota archaeon]|nr:diphosphomevalonate decarboxylase [Candidatus Micrarchaeota archaeon]
MDGKIVTAVGTPNKALIMYWGNRNTQLNLPFNSSLSITLGGDLQAKTSVVFSKSFKEDVIYFNGERIVLNGKAEGKMAALKLVLDQMRKMAGTTSKVLVVSKNSFPTGTGMASSAAGAVAFVYAASEALGLSLDTAQKSILARNISGSACRSLDGGFVMWHKGSNPDGSDSYAEQVADHRHWSEIIDMIAIVSEKQKKVSSTEGHKRTSSTSVLFKARVPYADAAVQAIRESILQKDFDSLAEITMQDSNNLQATMLDSWPPIVYLNSTSHEIIEAIHELNEREGRYVAAYTFDAGPNAHIITRTRDKAKVKEALSGINGIKQLIEVPQGDGPKILDESESLIDPETLKPVA